MVINLHYDDQVQQFFAKMHKLHPLSTRNAVQIMLEIAAVDVFFLGIDMRVVSDL